MINMHLSRKQQSFNFINREQIKSAGYKLNIGESIKNQIKMLRIGYKFTNGSERIV